MALVWDRRIRELPAEEFAADPSFCAVDGCEEPGRFEASWLFRGQVAGRPWRRRLRLCWVGAVEFATRHELTIEQPRQEVRA